jgi:hypothetical protein
LRQRARIVLLASEGLASRAITVDTRSANVTKHPAIHFLGVIFAPSRQA